MQAGGGAGPGAAGAAGREHTLTGSRLPRSISVYKSSQGSKKVRLQHFFTPDKSTVMSLACTPQSLYAGLVNGAVAVYAKAEGKRVCTMCASMRPLSWRFWGFALHGASRPRSCPRVCHRASQGACGFLNPERTA